MAKAEVGKSSSTSPPLLPTNDHILLTQLRNTLFPPDSISRIRHPKPSSSAANARTRSELFGYAICESQVIFVINNWRRQVARSPTLRARAEAERDLAQRCREKKYRRARVSMNYCLKGTWVLAPCVAIRKRRRAIAICVWENCLQRHKGNPNVEITKEVLAEHSRGLCLVVSTH